MSRIMIKMSDRLGKVISISMMVIYSIFLLTTLVQLSFYIFNHGKFSYILLCFPIILLETSIIVSSKIWRRRRRLHLVFFEIVGLLLVLIFIAFYKDLDSLYPNNIAEMFIQISSDRSMSVIFYLEYFIKSLEYYTTVYILLIILYVTNIKYIREF